MRRHATVYEIRGDEVDGLIRELQTEGFRVMDGFISRSIYHRSMLHGVPVGHLDKHFDNQHLYVLEIDGGNPLDIFVRNYESRAREAAQPAAPAE